MSANKTSPKPIRSTALGDMLRRTREEKQISLAQASAITKIRVDNLHKIEESDFSNFRSAVYATGMLKSYAKFLEIDPAKVMALYRRETEGPKPKIAEKISTTTRNFSLYSRRNLVIASCLIVLILVGGYFARQVSQVLTAPALELQVPVNLSGEFSGDIFVAGNSFRLAGKADTSSVVRFNSEALELDAEGNFSTAEIPLRESNLKVIITATNQLGKTTTINLTVKKGSPGIAEVDKMSILVEIADEVTPLLIRSDGKIEFDDRAFPGDIITLEARNTLQIESTQPQNIRLKINGEDFTVTGVNKTWELIQGKVLEK